MTVLVSDDVHSREAEGALLVKAPNFNKCQTTKHNHTNNRRNNRRYAICQLRPVGRRQSNFGNNSRNMRVRRDAHTKKARSCFRQDWSFFYT